MAGTVTYLTHSGTQSSWVVVPSEIDTALLGPSS